MTHPLIKIGASLSRTDESQRVKGECCLNNVLVEIKIYIKVVSTGYLILWKRSLKNPTKPNLDFIQGNEPELVPGKGQLTAGEIKDALSHLKGLLKSFEKITVLIITPDRKKLMDCSGVKTYYTDNSDSKGDREDLEALNMQIDSLKGPLKLIRRVILIN